MELNNKCPNCGIPMHYDGNESYMFGGTTDVFRCLQCGVCVRVLPPPTAHTTLDPFHKDAVGAREGDWVPFDDWSEELINAGLV